MFKKVKDLLKKKPSPPMEKKTKAEKPSPPQAEEVSAPQGEVTPSAISEKPREQRSVSATSEEGASKEPKGPTESKKPEEPKEPKTPSLKSEESQEPETVASPDPSSAVEPPGKQALDSSKGEKGTRGEREKVETAEEKPDVISSKGKKGRKDKKEAKETETTATEKPVKTDTVSQPKETSAVTLSPTSSQEPSGDTSSSHSEPEKEAKVSQTASKPKEPQRETVKLQGLFAFKMSMTSLYDDQGRRVPVTALKYKPWVVSQIKTRDKEGYSAAQLACEPQKNSRVTRPLIKHLTPAGFKEGARYIREVRQDLPENIKVGQELSIESLKKGDRVRVSSRSKGRGYAGVVKRWGFRGGPASHGSKTHRKTGSIGQCTQPSRVMPGRKMPGQYGFETITLNSVPVVDVLPSEGIIFVKGPVSGSRNTLVSLKKVEEARA